MKNMSAHQKNCEYCGTAMVRPRWSNGKLDSLFHQRRFCSVRCCADQRLLMDAPTDNAGRRRAQKAFHLGPCERCQKPGEERHHKDENPKNNEPQNIEILCKSCHSIHHHQEISDRKMILKKTCSSCGKAFLAKRKRSKLCGDPACLSAHGRANAMIRWNSGRKD